MNQMFIKFRDHKIEAFYHESEWYVAIRPICKALNVDMENARRRLNRHPILAQLPLHLTVVGSDGKRRKMMCLPERYIYGWLFALQSRSKELLEYQLSCYDVLYQHFNGSFALRTTALNELSHLNERERKLQNEIDELSEGRSAELKKVRDGIKAKRGQLTRMQKDWDRKLLSRQGSLFSPEQS